MLTQVPQQVNRSSRLVTLRHPNSIPCTIWRKVINRQPTEAPETLGSLPTIGGIGVLDSEDEADFTYEEVGEGRIMFLNQFQTQPGNWRDTDTDILYQTEAQPVEAFIECTRDPSDPAFVIATKPDLITVEPGAGIVLTYEVVAETSVMAIPPYTRKYLIVPRQDANVGI